MRERIDELFAAAALRDYPACPLELKGFLADVMEASRMGHLYLEKPTDLEIPAALLESVLHQKGNRIYLRTNGDCEDLFLKHLQRIKNEEPDLKISREVLEEKLGRVNLLPEQKEAVRRALQSSLTLITGGPGTGKSYTSKVIIALFSELTSGKVAVCAPTGKATGNLRKQLDAFPCPVKTLHGLLGERYLPYDLILVDEGSMIDGPMMAKLFSLVKEGSRLVMCGDPHQLPAIESGTFFADLVESEKDLVVSLTQSMRAELKEILEYGKMVNLGTRVPFLDMPDSELLIKKILDRFYEGDPFEALRRYRCLTPLRFGPYGVKTLNGRIYERLRRGMPLPMMITENNDSLGLYNGDVGILHGTTFRLENGTEYPLHALPRHELSFALSVHKSQGSEFDEVDIIIPKGCEVFGREMLYTAITRAKKRVQIYACGETIDKILLKRQFRRSGLQS